jgi:outer membrane protein OmpA-like peptidoglycan-associated protein
MRRAPDRRLLLAGLILTVSILVAPHAGAQSLPNRKVVIFFREWSAAFDHSATGTLNAVAKWAKEHPSVRFLVTGFADPRGSQQANAYLSELRAERVYDTLIEDGVPADRIERKGLAPGETTQPGLQSRRVEISAIP